MLRRILERRLEAPSQEYFSFKIFSAGSPFKEKYPVNKKTRVRMLENLCGWPYGYMFTMLLMFGISIAMPIFFRRKKWL